MKIKRITALALFCLAAGLAPTGARAGGPGILVTPDGKAFKRDNSQSLTYNLDLGKLGNLSNTKASIMVQNAVDALQSITTAKLTFEEGDPLDRDVTGDNLNDFINSLPTDVNPVIFDVDGTVIDAFLGSGASLGTLTFGGFLQYTPTGNIVQVMVVINGRMADGLFDPDDPSTDEMTRAVERAFMRTLNVQASDLNQELLFDGSVANNSAVPIMSPGVTAGNGLDSNLDDREVGSVTGAGTAPTLDDRMSISTLYPADSFLASTGVIRGKVLLPDGTTGLQGIDVIARNVSDPINSAVSTISGSLFLNVTGGGSTDPNLRGAFELRVPPGSYTVEIRQLRQSIGPRRGIFPLPGGARFYQSTPTAGPAEPAQATPVTVTAGQATEVNITTGGQAAPPPQQITEIATRHDSPATAQDLPSSAVVSGDVDPTKDPGSISLDVGNGVRDKVEDLYRLVLPQQSIVTLRLAQKEKVDLDLYVLGGIPGGSTSAIAGSVGRNTAPEALQLALVAGTYYIGVNSLDSATSPAPTAYTLEATTTPLPEATPSSRPVLDRLVVGNVTATGAQASWLTDRDASGDALIGLPRQQLGDPNVAKTHQVTVTGLTAGAFADLIAISQVPDGRFDSVPRAFFRTADKTPVQGPAKLAAAVVGQIEDFIGDDDNLTSTQMLAILIQNSGGDAANVQLTGLTASAGWKLATPVTDPIVVGGIGSGGTAVVVVRLLRDGTGDAPIPTVTGTGTLAGADGNPVSFTLGGP